MIGLVIIAGLVGAIYATGSKSDPADAACTMGKYFLHERFEARGLSAQIEKVSCEVAAAPAPGQWMLTGNYETAASYRPFQWTMRLVGPYDSNRWAMCELTLPNISVERGSNKRCPVRIS